MKLFKTFDIYYSLSSGKLVLIIYFYKLSEKVPFLYENT